MSEVVFYRKYRPQKLSNLVGQEHIKKPLSSALLKGRISHAYLFTGPKGTGKTTTARIIAKAVNCQKNQGKGEPCNKCKMCLSLTAGRALDLIEIDAASNRGIDDIRDLREKIKLAPALARFKVYIIDEVHMLTPEAFNALLKTLEEPPSHALFILCTTEPQKLPATIISRCQRFDFKKATIEELVEYLEKISRAEKIKAEKEALNLIAQNASGGFRDAASLLDQLINVSKGVLRVSDVQKFLTLTGESTIGEFMNYLSLYDTGQAIKLINRLVDEGGNLSVFVRNFLELTRECLLGKVGMESGVESPLGISDLKSLLSLFSQAAEELKGAVIPQLPLELAVVEWCEGGEYVEVTRRNFDSASDSARKIPSELTGQAREIRRPAPLNEVFTGSQSEASQNLSGSPRPKNVNLDKILGKWADLLAGVRLLNHSVEALLRAARPIKLDGEVLIIEVFYKFHKERLESPQVCDLLEKVISEVVGRKLKIKFILGERKKEKKQTEGEELEKIAEEIFGGKVVEKDAESS